MTLWKIKIMKVSKQMRWCTLLYRQPSTLYWIGLSCYNSTSLQWSDGSAYSYSWWPSGTSLCSSSNQCAFINNNATTNPNLYWTLAPCSNTYTALCQRGDVAKNTNYNNLLNGGVGGVENGETYEAWQRALEASYCFNRIKGGRITSNCSYFSDLMVKDVLYIYYLGEILDDYRIHCF